VEREIENTTNSIRKIIGARLAAQQRRIRDLWQGKISKRKPFHELSHTQKAARANIVKEVVAELTGEDFAEIAFYEQQRAKSKTADPSSSKMTGAETWEMQCSLGFTEAQVNGLRKHFQHLDKNMKIACAATARKYKKSEQKDLIKQLGAIFSQDSIAFDLPSVLTFAIKHQYPDLHSSSGGRTLHLEVKVTEDGRLASGHPEVVLSTTILSLRSDSGIKFEAKFPIQSDENMFPLAAFEGKEDSATLRAYFSHSFSQINNIKQFVFKHSDGSTSDVHIKWIPLADLKGMWILFDFGGPCKPYNCPFCNSQDAKDRADNFGTHGTFVKNLGDMDVCIPLWKLPISDAGVCMTHFVSRIIADFKLDTSIRACMGETHYNPPKIKNPLLDNNPLLHVQDFSTFNFKKCKKDVLAEYCWMKRLRWRGTKDELIEAIKNSIYQPASLTDLVTFFKEKLGFNLEIYKLRKGRKGFRFTSFTAHQAMRIWVYAKELCQLLYPGNAAKAEFWEGLLELYENVNYKMQLTKAQWDQKAQNLVNIFKNEYSSSNFAFISIFCLNMGSP
jgi:hypothetical protein